MWCLSVFARTDSRQALAYSNLLPALAAAAQVLATTTLLDLPRRTGITLLTACGTFLVYQLDRGLPLSPEDRLNAPERVAWFARHRAGWLAASTIAGGTSLLLWMREPPAVQAGVALVALGALLYILPVLPGRRRLKNLAAAKPLLLPLAWGGGCVLLPVLSAGDHPGPSALVLVLYRALYVAPNFLLADLPDRSGDARAGLPSPAVRQATPALLRNTRLLLLAAACMLPALAALGCSPLLLAVDGTGLLLLFGLSRCAARRAENLPLLADLAVTWPLATWLLGG